MSGWTADVGSVENQTKEIFKGMSVMLVTRVGSRALLNIVRAQSFMRMAASHRLSQSQENFLWIVSTFFSIEPMETFSFFALHFSRFFVIFHDCNSNRILPLCRKSKEALGKKNRFSMHLSSWISCKSSYGWKKEMWSWKFHQGWNFLTPPIAWDLWKFQCCW